MPDIEQYSKDDFEKAKQHTEDGFEFWYARYLKELGGTMPEDLKMPEKSIKEIEEKHKKRLVQGELE